MNKDILLHNQRKFHGYIVLCLVAQSCPVVCDPVDCNPPGFSVHMDSLGKNTRVGCHALLQGIFPTQRSNPGLLHWRWIIYQLKHQGSPRILGSKTCMVLTALFLMPKFRRKTRVVFLISWVKLDFIVLIKSTTTTERGKKEKEEKENPKETAEQVKI